MDIQGIAAIVFILLMAIFLYLNRSKIKMQSVFFPLLYFVMLRTKIGLKSMDSFAKRFPRLLTWLGNIGFVIGFFGMAFICYELVKNTVNLLLKPEVAAGVQPVLPFEAKGVFFVPFIYWIISIFVIAVVHEFSHGIMARVHGLKIKSSGLAFLGIVLPIVPAAFVEPDETRLVKRSVKAQLSVFAAGPFANILLAGLVILLIVYAANPAVAHIFDAKGVKVVSTVKDGPFYNAGIQPEEIITHIEGKPVTYVSNLTDILDKYQPGQRIIVKTNISTYAVTLSGNPKNESRPFLGIGTRQYTEPKTEFTDKFGSFLPLVIIWIIGLLYWLFILNLGIGLFNLMPIGPIDGGRMLKLACERIHAKKGPAIFRFVSMFFLMVVLFNVIAGFI